MKQTQRNYTKTGHWKRLVDIQSFPSVSSYNNIVIISLILSIQSEKQPRGIIKKIYDQIIHLNINQEGTLGISLI